MRFHSFPVGKSVFIEGGVVIERVSPTDPDDIDSADSGSGLNGKAAFMGGKTYIVTEGEKDLLEAAGYTVEVV
jgi:hypothetical protein